MGTDDAFSYAFIKARCILELGGSKIFQDKVGQISFLGVVMKHTRTESNIRNTHLVPPLALRRDSGACPDAKHKARCLCGLYDGTALCAGAVRMHEAFAYRLRVIVGMSSAR